jgi:hypothetical protein
VSGESNVLIIFPPVELFPVRVHLRKTDGSELIYHFFLEQ